MKLKVFLHASVVATVALGLLVLVYSRYSGLRAEQVISDGRTRLNVLFIIVDELRPQLAAYEGPDYAAPYDKHKIETPNIDKLSARSLTLTRAYSQYSLFGPSRASMLTSRRPDVTKVYKNHMQMIGRLTSLPEYFNDNDYYTVGAGKFFHFRHNSWRDWSEPFMSLSDTEYNSTNYNWHAVDDEDGLPDAYTVDFAIEKLAELSRKPKSALPFFLAVGINKPHAPHACPHKYFTKYDLETGQFLINRTWQSPLYRLYTSMLPFSDETSNNDLDRIPEDALKELRRAYFACVSYVDDLIGSLMSAVQRNKLDDSTIVILLADHGLHLGDNDVYGKYTNHEIATHVPLIVRIPGITDNGTRSRSLVELVDVFPTIVEAAGLRRLPRCPKQSANITLCTDGQSFMPLVFNTNVTIKNAVFSQVSRGRNIMEYAIRTARYRYIDYAMPNITAIERDAHACRTRWNIPLQYTTLQQQLYDLELDPAEQYNVINDADYEGIVFELAQDLHRKFRYIYNFSQDVYLSIADNQDMV